MFDPEEYVALIDQLKNDLVWKDDEYREADAERE
jgi:hypothetical protein